MTKSTEKQLLSRIKALESINSQLLSELEEIKQAEETARINEQRIKSQLNHILSPEENISDLALADIIDAGEIESMMDNFYNLTHIPTAIIDIYGKMLVGVGWQNICTQFHRVHPETCKNCIESDTELTTGIPEGEFKLYKCKNGMWDLATPIMIGNEHMGNLFMGQFFFDDEPIDFEFFRSRSKQFGFDEDAYITALQNVPKLKSSDLNSAKAFFAKLAHSISALSFSNIKLTRLLNERNTLMDSLLQSEERFRSMFEKPKAVMLLIDPDSGRIIDANNAASEFYGWTHEQLCSMSIQEINLLSEEEVTRERQTALNEHRNYFIFPHRLANGESRWVEVYSSPITIREKQILFSVIHDITERKMFEDNLLISEGNIRAILNAVQESITMFDQNGNIIAANTTTANRMNLPLEKITGHNLSEFVSPNLFKGATDTINEVFNSGKPVRLEDNYNNVIFIHNFYPVFNNDQVSRVVLYSQDITSSRLSEKLIEHLASFPKLNPDPVLEIDLTGMITYFNEAALSTLSKINAGEDIRLFLPADINGIISSIGESVESESCFREIIINDHTFSESIYFTRQFNVFRIYITDITERKKTEDQLRKLSRAVEHSPDSIVITDSNGIIEYANPMFSKITGYSIKEAIGKTPGLMKSGATNPETYKHLWETIKNGKEWRGAFQNRKKSGELFWESVNISPVLDQQGNITHFVAIKEDITQRIKREEKLYQLNRTLNAIRHIGDAIIRAGSEQEYLNDICNIIINDCGHALIWIGYVEHDAQKSVRPVASAGFEEGYLEKLNVTWADTEHGRGPTGTAIRRGEVSICSNMLNDPHFIPWREEAIKRGYASSVVFPLKKDGKVFGAVSIYAKEPDAFSEDEISLLTELADDLVHGITIIRLRLAHQLAEKELKDHKDNLEKLVKRRTSELETANEVLNEAQSVAHIGHWRLDLANGTLEWSDEIFRIFGIEPNAFGATLEAFLNFVHPDDRDYVSASYTESVKNKTGYNIEHRIVRPDGSIRIVHEQCITHYDAEDNPSHSLGIVQDITEHKKAEQELEMHKDHLEELVKTRTGELDFANQQLKFEIEKEKQVELLLQQSLEKEKELNELKSRFISTTSHEFRTPLTSVLSSTQLIQRYRKKWSDEKLDEQFGHIKNSIFNLTKLLDDILTISYADSGRIVYNPQLINLHQLCIEIIEEIKHRAGENHKFNFSFTPEKEFLLDPKLIRFIIINLLSNAFKYSPEGGKVNLKVSASIKYIQITVSDEGIGIPEADREHLFKPFSRAGNTGDIEGTGLGLSIVQRAVELHKGVITYNSETGKGTKFIVKIPRGNNDKNTDN